MKKLIFLILFSFILISNIEALPSPEIYRERVMTNFTDSHYSAAELAKIEHLTMNVYKNEKKYSEKYYQFLTAQDSHFIAYQVILKALYELKYQRSFNEFEFLRAYRDPELKKELWDLFAEFPDLFNIKYIHSALNDPSHPDAEKYKKGFDNDHNNRIQKQLIAASLTLESNQPTESALGFFKWGQNIHDHAFTGMLAFFLIEAFAFEGMDSEEAIATIEFLLSQAPFTKMGILLQIFIPKEDIYNGVYVSFPFGYVNIEWTQNLHGYFAHLESLRESSNFDPNEDNQVRILTGSLVPDRTKIFRHTLIPANELQKYEMLVRKEIKKLFKK